MTTSPMRIVFMGTPAFAVPTLRALVEQAQTHSWRVVGVLTQPDRPAGRGNKVVASPVKEYALSKGIPVLQPVSLRKDAAAVDSLRALKPDLIVVAAYGLILPASVLAIPQHGCINVHASLLPAYRGASPITAALLDGLTETGVSIMLMDAGLDTGPVLSQVRTPIHPDDTTASLSERLADQGATALVETAARWVAGELTPIAQSDLPGSVSHCQTIKKSAGRIDWTQSAVQIERMTRAYTPWPSAQTTWRGALLKIWRATVLEGNAEPGLVVATPHGPAVATGDGLLGLQTIQPAGKRAMDAQSFLNGAPDFVGSRLGSDDKMTR